MYYKTYLGKRVEYPYSLVAKIIKESKREDVSLLIHKSKEIFDALRDVDGKLTTMVEENIRLKCENEFMIRFINDLINKSPNLEDC